MAKNLYQQTFGHVAYPSSNWTSYLIESIPVNDDYRIKALADQNAVIDTFVDLGGNVGITSIFANLWFPGIKIWSIEVCEVLFQYLERNTKNIPNITRINAAFGDGSELFLAPDVINSISARVDTFSTKGPKIKTKVLPELLPTPQELGVYYFKIDVEGSERYLLHEANLSYLQSARYIGIEYHYDCNRLSDTEAMLLKETLHKTHLPIYSQWGTTCAHEFLVNRSWEGRNTRERT